jgi:hypothetical protein
MSPVQHLKAFCDQHKLDFPIFDINDSGNVNKVFWYDNEIDFSNHYKRYPVDAARHLIDRLDEYEGNFFIELMMSHQKKYSRFVSSFRENKDTFKKTNTGLYWFPTIWKPRN